MSEAAGQGAHERQRRSRSLGRQPMKLVGCSSDEAEAEKTRPEGAAGGPGRTAAGRSAPQAEIFATRASTLLNAVGYEISSHRLESATSVQAAAAAADALVPLSPLSDALTQSTSDELSPAVSQAVLDRFRKVGFAAGMSDLEDQKLFAAEPLVPRQTDRTVLEEEQTEAVRSAGFKEDSREAGGDDRNCVRTESDGAEDSAIRLKQLDSSLRYSRPRMSLLGKPISLKNARQDARYRRLQARVYNFLERPKTWQSITYHVIVFASVFICLVFSVLSTMSNCVRDAILKPSLMPGVASSQPTGAPTSCSKFAFKYSEVASEILFYMETGMLFWFFTEYCLRMWSAGCRSRYQTWRGRLLFARRPFCIVDSIVIVASIIVLALGSDRQMFAASALRGLRFFQILRMIRMDRRGGSWKLLASVVWAHRQELFTTVYIGFLGLIFSSFVMYLIEKDEQDTQISNYADALWWGVGILGSGFALKVQQHQRQKHLIRRRVPAATLIQSLWRCYAADPSSTSMATWKPHMRPLRSPCSKFGRLSTIKRSKSERTHGPGSASYTPIRRNAMPDLDPGNPQAASEVAFVSGKSHVSLAMTEAAATGTVKLEQQPSLTSIAHEEDETPMKLTEVHRNAIRVIRKVKYFVARKKFREALRPYDVKDVIEQYSAGHVDMLARIKVLQFRLDQILGRQGSKDKDVYESKVSLASRIVKVERSVEDIERKLELLIDMYKEDRRAVFAEQTPPASICPPAPSPPDGGGAGARMMLNSIGSADSEASQPFPHSMPQRGSLRSRRSVLRQEEQQASAAGSQCRKLTRNYSDLGPRQPKRVTYHYPGADVPIAEPKEQHLATGHAAQICEAQIHNDFAAASSAPSPPPPPLKSLIDFDDDEDDECQGRAGDTDEDDAFYNTPPAPPPPPSVPLRSALKPMRSCPAASAPPRTAAASNRHSFTNRALDDSEDDGQDQERRRLLCDLPVASARPAIIPMTSSRKLGERASSSAASQPALMRPELNVKLRKKKTLY